jgi:hypothetical protein
MPTLALLPLTCWLCALIALPRRPRLGNEVEELVYTRLLGRGQWLVLLASVVTVVTLLGFVLALPRRIDPTLDAERHPPQVCKHDSWSWSPICFTRQQDGTWVEEAVQGNGTWWRVGVVAEPPPEEGGERIP